MSDSGLSLASSSGPVSGDNDRDQAGDYHGGQPGDGGLYRGQAGDPRPCPRLSHGPGLHLSKSVANLHSSASASDQESVSLSRADSVCSLASSSSTQITAAEIRSLTNNYQRMLARATKQIKRLNVEKWKVEQEQDKLLNTNLELAEEVRKLIVSDKQWRKEKQELLTVNEEFAAEVERLYKSEEQHLADKDELGRQLQQLQGGGQLQLQEERGKLELQIRRLTQALDSMKVEHQQLQDTNTRREQNLSSKQEDILLNQERELGQLQRSLEEARLEAAEERRRREEAASEVKQLEAEVRRLQLEAEQLRRGPEEEPGVERLREHNEKLTAENFEYAVENNELKKKIQKIQDREKGMKKELSDVKTENQWLVNNQKSGSPNKKSEDSVKQMEAMRNELKEEKDKVKNLTVWKSQLSEKNKELKEENAKLLNKVEDLERLMNDEVTDINEILNVINTIQVDKQIPELKHNKGHRFL